MWLVEPSRVLRVFCVRHVDLWGILRLLRMWSRSKYLVEKLWLLVHHFEYLVYHIVPWELVVGCIIVIIAPVTTPAMTRAGGVVVVIIIIITKVVRKCVLKWSVVGAVPPPGGGALAVSLVRRRGWLVGVKQIKASKSVSPLTHHAIVVPLPCLTQLPHLIRVVCLPLSRVDNRVRYLLGLKD